MANYVGERGVVMEDNKEEENDNNISDCATRKAFANTLMEDVDDEEIPEDGHVDDLVRFYKMHIGTAKMIKKKAKLQL
jgi:formylmethanofuran:tetrahydromethanopterin formyltransferase